MGTVLKSTFILENSTTWRSLNSQEPLFMRHYLILLIWFLLFQAEACEPEIKENFISEAPGFNRFEAKIFYSAAAPELSKYFTQSCSIIFPCLVMRSVKQQGSLWCVCPIGTPAIQIASEQSKTSSSSSQLSHGNTGTFRSSMSTSFGMLLLYRQEQSVVRFWTLNSLTGYRGTQKSVLEIKISK